MDEVKLTRAQLKAMAAKNVDFVVTAVNGDAGLILVEELKKVGQNYGKWLRPDGLTREGKKL